jgi:hypothetical protein
LVVGYGDVMEDIRVDDIKLLDYESSSSMDDERHG